MPSSTKYYVFTLNNPTEEEEKALVNNGVGPDGPITYLVFGREIGESGTPHFQGYLELKSRRALSYVKRIGGLARAHFERRRGSAEQAADYCKKDGSFIELGTRSESNQGRRSDLELAFEALDNGATDREMWINHGEVMLRYEKAMKRARIMRSEVPVLTERTVDEFNINLDIDWAKSQLLVGPSGIGKTEYAKALLPKALFVSHMDELSGFNEEHEGIIFDDMSFEHLPRTAQIHLVDQDNNRAVHIRYTIANIPAHTKKVFLSNTMQCFTWDPAVTRRVQIHELHGRLFE